MVRLNTPLLIGILLLFAPRTSPAQQQAPSVTLDEVYQMVQKQQQMIDSQNSQIEAQQQTIRDQNKAMQALSTRLDQLAQAQAQLMGTDVGAPTKEQIVARQQAESTQMPTSVNTNSKPADVLQQEDFPGSIRIPGTNMAAKTGGFVRVGLVSNFAPIGSDDRFIVGTIPVPGEDDTTDDTQLSGVNISAKRSRLNLDMRMDSSVGQFRAYTEGDFATNVDGSDVFRLRQAFGQYNRFILGQTWTTFMDLDAEPEELDFEGLNSEIIERHPILRWTKGLGNRRTVALALEDPEVEIANGEGKSNTADFVSNVKIQKDWGHVQLAAVLRDLAGEETIEVNDGDTSNEITRSGSTFGWGLSLSGKYLLTGHTRSDNLKFQLVFGEGIGRYINDLSSVGGQDAVFSPDGKLDAIPAIGGYLAFQKYWKRDPTAVFGFKGLLKDLRSTVVYGLVDLDNFDFQPSSAYKRTQRASANLIWSPLKQIDLGLEFLWGSREDKSGNKGTASQLQIVATFFF